MLAGGIQIVKNESLRIAKKIKSFMVLQNEKVLVYLTCITPQYMHAHIHVYARVYIALFDKAISKNLDSPKTKPNHVNLVCRTIPQATNLDFCSLVFFVSFDNSAKDMSIDVFLNPVCLFSLADESTYLTVRLSCVLSLSFLHTYIRIYAENNNLEIGAPENCYSNNKYVVSYNNICIALEFVYFFYSHPCSPFVHLMAIYPFQVRSVNDFVDKSRRHVDFLRFRTFGQVKLFFHLRSLKWVNAYILTSR
ncbi:hypothetical protein EGR_10214 [Echinococcus granulosus]|uniref:Uncharacterized protein n=1 Tax=Echinococcus granulosus TaxID=6210 RepID=W6U8W5_ECHGR|nr:hypothetical protein EGR_10214 [Echinococcus granulosus]EUB54932.1 hypothetical protein EGR_10214 [Echinococcus granulosus]